MTRSEHITPILAQLHWLEIAERIEYKVALLTFNALTTGKPDYLSDQLQLCAPVRQLRSGDRKNRLYLNSHRTTFASRAFWNGAPVVWNSLPHQLTDDLSSAVSFRRNLKTHLFSKSLRHWLSWPVRDCDSSIYFWLTYVASSTANNNSCTFKAVLSVGTIPLPSQSTARTRSQIDELEEQRPLFV